MFCPRVFHTFLFFPTCSHFFHTTFYTLLGRYTETTTKMFRIYERKVIENEMFMTSGRHVGVCVGCKKMLEMKPN